MTTILVTGGAGFIASNIVDQYIAMGHRVIIIDNLYSGFKRNLNPKAVFYEMDIRDKNLEKIFEDEKIEIVNHHAAQIDVRHSVEKPEYDAQVNIIGAINLLECSKKYKIRKIIYSSTGGAVYGEPEYLPADEEHPVNPECHYGVSKYTVENYIKLYHRLYNIDYTIFRYPNIFGPRQNPYGEAGVNAIFIGQMIKGTIPVIFGDGNQLRDYLYVEDVVKANTMVLSAGSNKTYNLGTGVGTSVNKIYQILQNILKFPNPQIHAEPRKGEIEKIYLDSSLIFKELGWKASVSYEDGLKKTIEYFKSNIEIFKK
ncbi:NAD-dependent epimerase/dehydratase family protein [Candidatus Desantisbacteria bacterium]|nr:NAD-dependent epimerase/dehydratase family protein [Candidatus Desantisbacteria bacterium]